MTPARLDAIAVAVLGGLICLAFLPAVTFGFVDFDDYSYIRDNDTVRFGLSFESFLRSWRPDPVVNNWHPLTWWSHALDVTLFGLDARGHHVVNLLWHLGVSGVVYALGIRLCGARLPAMLGAAVFAIHPLRVESVVWVSERKDLLCAFFWLLACWFWIDRDRRSSTRTMVIVCGCAACALLAKPMAVTLPVTLLLLDAWPLRRTFTMRLVQEKAPLVLMSVATAAMTVEAQRSGLTSTAALSLAERLVHIPVAVWHYLTTTMAPHDLSPLYRLRPDTPAEVAVGSLAFVGITGLALVAWRRGERGALVGWLWFLVTLVPVLGVLHVGRQAFADRYTYVPGLGLLLMAGLAVGRVARGMTWRWPGLVVAMYVVVLVPLTRAQTAIWSSTEALYTHTLSLDEEHTVALVVLARERRAAGDLDGAGSLARRAIAIAPDAEAWGVLAAVAHARKDMPAALANADQALALDARNAAAHGWRGLALAGLGQIEPAIESLRRCVALDPRNVGALANLALLHERRQEFGESLAAFRAVVALAPDDVAAHARIGRALVGLGRTAEAIAHLTAVRDRARARGDQAGTRRLEAELARAQAAPP